MIAKSLLHPKYIPSWLAIFGLRCLCFLPLRWLLSIGTIVGTLMSYVFKNRRHVAEVNIDLCFPELTTDEKKNLVDKIMISSILGVLETAYSWWANDEDLLALCDYEGLELIEEQQKAGRGILLFGTHFTTLDLSGRLLRLKVNYDCSYQKQNNPVFDYCILQYRLKRFTNMVEKTEMRRLVKLIKSGGIMWYASDQDFGRKHSVFAPFFGQQTATISAISGILKLTKAKPLHFTHYRIGSGKNLRYLIRITDPFKENLGADDVKNATIINRAMEKAIRVAPEQYMWVHRRFKTRPQPTDAKFYPKKKRKAKPTTKI